MTIRHLIVISLALVLFACNKQDSKVASLAGGSGSCSGEGASSVTGPLFKIGDVVITRDDLPDEIKEAIFQSEYEAYTRTLSITQEFALRIYLAKKQDKLQDPKNPPPLTDLVEFPNITDEEIKKVYEANKHRMPKDVSFEQMKGQIVHYLKSQKIGSIFQDEVQKMEDSGEFVSLLTAPMSPEMEIATNDYPKKGKKDAKIEVIEISDYLCGHCQHANPEVHRIFEKYKDKIQFTQINFALRPTALSGTYARGGFCAQKQSEALFWTYHDEAFKKASEPHKHVEGHKHTDEDGNAPESIDKVMDVATLAGLDLKKFKECLNSKEAQAHIFKTNNDLNQKGINGTPVFIVNKKKIPNGVQGLEDAIKEAL